jgi:hypothetical protein
MATMLESAVRDRRTTGRTRPTQPDALLEGVLLDAALPEPGAMGDATLASLLAAALDGRGGAAAGEADGFLVVARAWEPAAGDAPWGIRSGLAGLAGGRPLAGRPVGLVLLGADAVAVAASLAWLRSAVTARGAFLVGTGIAVDEADAGPAGHGLADVTLASVLAQLGRRVHDLARNRRVLRAG